MHDVPQVARHHHGQLPNIGCSEGYRLGTRMRVRCTSTTGTCFVATVGRCVDSRHRVGTCRASAPIQLVCRCTSALLCTSLHSVSPILHLSVCISSVAVLLLILLPPSLTFMVFRVRPVTQEAATIMRKHHSDQYQDRVLYWNLRLASRVKGDVLVIIIDAMDKVHGPVRIETFFNLQGSSLFQLGVTSGCLRPETLRGLVGPDWSMAGKVRLAQVAMGSEAQRRCRHASPEDGFHSGPTGNGGLGNTSAGLGSETRHGGGTNFCT